MPELYNPSLKLWVSSLKTWLQWIGNGYGLSCICIDMLLLIKSLNSYFSWYLSVFLRVSEAFKICCFKIFHFFLDTISFNYSFIFVWILFSFKIYYALVLKSLIIFLWEWVTPWVLTWFSSCLPLINVKSGKSLFFQVFKILLL